MIENGFGDRCFVVLVGTEPTGRRQALLRPTVEPKLEPRRPKRDRIANRHWLKSLILWWVQQDSNLRPAD